MEQNDITFKSLPTEIKQQIFLQLPTVKDFCNVSSVCRDFFETTHDNSLAPHILKEIGFSINGTENYSECMNKIEQLINRNSKLKKPVKINKIKDKNFIDVLAEIKHTLKKQAKPNKTRKKNEYEVPSFREDMDRNDNDYIFVGILQVQRRFFKALDTVEGKTTNTNIIRNLSGRKKRYTYTKKHSEV